MRPGRKEIENGVSQPPLQECCTYSMPQRSQASQPDRRDMRCPLVICPAGRERRSMLVHMLSCMSGAGAYVFEQLILPKIWLYTQLLAGCWCRLLSAVF